MALLGAAEGEYDFAAVRGALIKLFPDTIISQEKRSVPDRKRSHVTDRKPSDRFKNRFCKPRDGKTGRYIAHETDAHDAEEDPNSEEEESCEEDSDLTAAFEREMDELVSVVEELEDTLDVQDVNRRRELSEPMYEGLARIRQTHAKLREKTRNRGYQPSSSASSHAAFGSRHASLTGTGRGKGKIRPEGGSVHHKKLVTRCFDCNRFGHSSDDLICPAKDKHDAQTQFTSCNVKGTVHVQPESFVTSSLSVEHELRRAGACDTCCNRTVARQEWMNDLCPLTQKADIEVLDDALSRTLHAWSWCSSVVQDTLHHSSQGTLSVRSHAKFRGAKKTDAANWQTHVESVGSTI